MPLTKSKITELNAEIAYHEVLFRRGKISYEQFEAERHKLIGEYYMKYYDDEMNCLLDYEKDSEPKGLLGVAVKLLRKLF
tara:strand:+ start:4452 stop:4691 length:240 start_codon:yes stop_codon:yes gene_type:complete